MNLIERLGGYAAAKEWYKDQDLRGNHTVRIRAALLEYRREHNIFEDGDVAVSVDGEPYLHKVELGTSKVHCIKIFSHDMKHSYWVHDANYRHATPAEIAAGYRLN